MTSLEQQACGHGYVRCPNQATRWYPAGPSLPQLPSFLDVHIEEHDINERPVVVLARKYGTPKTLFPIMKFDDFNQLIEFIKTIKTVSSPGLPAYSNSWD